jgi:hypothetical protein
MATSSSGSFGIYTEVSETIFMVFKCSLAPSLLISHEKKQKQVSHAAVT